MNAKLVLAVAATTLAIAPAALAQTTTYENDASRAGYERSSPSGLPNTSPQVRSLPGAEPDPWTDRPAGSTMDNRTWNDRSMSGGSAGTAGTSGTMGTTGTSGSTGAMGTTGTMDTTGTTQGGRQVLMNVDRSDTQARSDRGQNSLELMQTSLLNYFSAAGFTAVRDFRKQGESYVAEAQDQNGRWTTVEMDPRTGTIAAVR